MPVPSVTVSETRVPPRGPEPMLGERRQVRVVVHGDRESRARRDLVREGEVAPVRQVGGPIDQFSARWIDHARASQPEHDERLGHVLTLRPHRRDDRLERRHGAPLGARGPALEACERAVAGARAPT